MGRINRYIWFLFMIIIGGGAGLYYAWYVKPADFVDAAMYNLRQDYKTDYVLMVDSDTQIPPDTLDLMLDPPADVVLGVCPRKNTKDGKTAIIKLGAQEYHDNYYYSDLPKERTRVKGGGFACALIKTSVFTQLDYPWFQYAINEDYSTLSEDFYFCQLAAMFGVEIWMEPRVRCGHLARYYQYE